MAQRPWWCSKPTATGLIIAILPRPCFQPPEVITNTNISTRRLPYPVNMGVTPFLQRVTGFSSKGLFGQTDGSPAPSCDGWSGGQLLGDPCKPPWLQPKLLFALGPTTRIPCGSLRCWSDKQGFRRALSSGWQLYNGGQRGDGPENKACTQPNSGSVTSPTRLHHCADIRTRKIME